MNLLRKLLGLDPPSGLPAQPEDTPTTARGWLAAAAARDGCVWRDLGVLALPSRRLFVGDPTWGTTITCARPHRSRWTRCRSGYSIRVRTHPLTRRTPTPWSGWRGWAHRRRRGGRRWISAVDAACFAVGDIEAGHAFTRLTDHDAAAGRGDSFEWIQPYIQERPHVARWLVIPPDGKRMFVASTGRDGGFAATWLHDRDGALSGILIDILGRAGDGRFLDTLLPERPAPPTRG